MLSPILCPRCYLISCLLSLGCPAIRLSLVPGFQILWHSLEKDMSPHPSKMWKERKNRKARRRQQGGDKDRWEQEKGNNSGVEAYAPVFKKENFTVRHSWETTSPTEFLELKLSRWLCAYKERESSQLYYRCYQYFQYAIWICSPWRLWETVLWMELWCGGDYHHSLSCFVILSRPLRCTQDQNTS